MVESADRRHPVANKNRAKKPTKKAATRDLKEKRAAKRAKKAGGSATPGVI